MLLQSIRVRILLLVMVGTIINYIARNSLGALAPVLISELHLSTEQYSYVVGAFQISYTVMQPLVGILIDNIGLTIGFSLCALIWSLASMAHGLAHSWIGLAGFRAILGLSESAAIPSGMKAIGEWFPDRERSIAVGWFNAGTSLGAVIAPILATFVAVRYGWASAFAVTGILGVIFALTWLTYYRSPQQATFLGETERSLIESSQREVISRSGTLNDLVRLPRFWAIAVPRFFAEPAWQTFSFWIPLYFARERGMDLTQIALFAWVPFLAADLGGIFAGYASVKLQQVAQTKLEISRITIIGLASILMIAPGAVGYVMDPVAVVILLAIGGFGHQAISVMINTLSADVFNKSDIAKANGLIGMWGWTGGLIFSLIVGQLADRVGFMPLFLALGLFDLIGFAWIFFMRRHIVL